MTSPSLIPFNYHYLYLIDDAAIQANETEIPLIHEFNGAATENGTSIEVCFSQA